jgi:hypothetical protein
MLELDEKEQINIKIHDNIFKRSTKPAITLSDKTRYFSIYDNVFLFNDGSNETYNPSKKQVDDGGLNNEWNLTNGPGNYWSDWQLEDLDEDGDVDLPMPIKGQTYDHHPISRTNSSIVRPPANVRALGADGKIVLTWEKPARNPFMDPYHYTLYRSEAGSPYKVLCIMTEGILSYIDTDVKEAVNYSYYLVSNNSFGYGKPSSIVTSMVDIEPPTLRIIEPEDGSIFKVSNVTVEWEVSDPIGIGKVELKLDNEREWLNVTGQSNHTFHHLIDSKYTLEVKAIDRIGNTRERNVSFMVDTTPPEIELRWSNEDRISFRGKLDVSWKCSDLVSGISEVSYELDQGESVLVGSEWTLSLQDLEHGHHSFKLKAIDLAGNEMTIDEDLMMDLVEPVLEILEPISGTITNDANVTISWTCQDIDTRILYIQGKVDGLEVFNLSWTDVEYRTRLEDGYHLIEVSASDAAGNVVSRSVNITIDTISPYVVSFGPVGMEVNITESVWVVISEDLTLGSYSMTAIGIEGRTYWEGNKLVLEPDQDLIPGKNYSVKVIGTDLAGNEFDHSWSFRTCKGEIPNGSSHPDEEKIPLWLVMAIVGLVSIMFLLLAVFLILRKRGPSSTGTDLEEKEESGNIRSEDGVDTNVMKDDIVAPMLIENENEE